MPWGAENLPLRRKYFAQENHPERSSPDSDPTGWCRPTPGADCLGSGAFAIELERGTTRPASTAAADVLGLRRLRRDGNHSSGFSEPAVCERTGERHAAGSSGLLVRSRLLGNPALSAGGVRRETVPDRMVAESRIPHADCAVHRVHDALRDSSSTAVGSLLGKSPIRRLLSGLHSGSGDCDRCRPLPYLDLYERSGLVSRELQLCRNKPCTYSALCEVAPARPEDRLDTIPVCPRSAP